MARLDAIITQPPRVSVTKSGDLLVEVRVAKKIDAKMWQIFTLRGVLNRGANPSASWQGVLATAKALHPIVAIEIELLREILREMV